MPNEEPPTGDTLHPSEFVPTVTNGSSPDQRDRDPKTVIGLDLKASNPSMAGSLEENPSVSGDRTTGMAFTIDEPEQPTLIGRYRVKKLLGRGGFGLVYLAHDEPLNRLVAIKVPHLKLLPRSEIAEAYLSEARTVANLDHPHIVPVYDVGSTPSCPCYIVSKYIDGTDLASRIRHSRLPIQESISLVATVADALHYAHTQHLVHRDVKPGNILLDQTGRPFVADFGLALREQEVNEGPYYVGTPPYMSPEQVRGEGHRVDGRSDIFSLGVVLYELVVGRRPYIATSNADVLEQISNYEPRPPRQYDESISKELDRICLKTLAKRASERYSTAKDLAEDLRHCLTTLSLESASDGVTTNRTGAMHQIATEKATEIAPSKHAPESTIANAPIVPKGLRSFDAHDKDFFLEMVPGPRDRNGLPDSIRFWRTHIEESTVEQPFPVGLICGPSGSGKSSLVKAGLLPRLSDSVIIVYVEASRQDTEFRLLNGIRKRCPFIPQNIGLKETLALLRRGQRIPSGKKVLVILDQFEQWLHAKQGEQNTELVTALRQCDGERLQCLVMVRDDFWMAVIRFMRELEIRLVEGYNTASVELLPIQHAEKVLLAFGQAYGALPERTSAVNAEQRMFVSQAVRSISVEGVVAPVRLALFAEMMKDKRWTPKSLRDAGGTEGVVSTFLEGTFDLDSASPEHHYHQKAARGVLSLLLPKPGTDIKGHMRSQSELRDAAGYLDRPADFDDLIRILDGELRLITPTDPEGHMLSEDSERATSNLVYYELTHDYLVPALRDWLTKKQKETQRGRMELKLQDRTALWTSRRERQQLPTFFEWLGILWHTPRTAWTTSNRAMINAATHVYVRRCFTTATLFLLLGIVALFVRHQFRNWEAERRISSLVEQLWQVQLEHVPGILSALEPERAQWIDRVREVANSTAVPADGYPSAAVRARAQLALSPVDNQYVPMLVDRLLVCEHDEHTLIRQEMNRRQAEVTQEAENRIKRRGMLAPEVTRAGALLASYAPDSTQWVLFGPELVNSLVSSDPFTIEPWINDLTPVRVKLWPRLKEICLDQSSASNQRLLATSMIAQFSRADLHYLSAEDLLELVLSPDESIGRGLNELLSQRRDDVLPLLLLAGTTELPMESSEETERLAERQSRAVLLSQKLGEDGRFWKHLDDQVDPRVRTFLINQFSQANITWKQAQERWPSLPARSRQALLLGIVHCFSNYSESEREAAKEFFLGMYRVDPDAGVHSAIEYGLRTMGAEDQLKAEQTRLAIERASVGNWSVLPNRLCMIAIKRPGRITIGSDSSPDEATKKKTSLIDYPFEISATEITVEQFQQFRADVEPAAAVTPSKDSAMNLVDLVTAMKFCRWLSEQDPDFVADRCVYPAVETMGQDLVLAPDYQSWQGFRLPTVHEWEYACRAGSETDRFFGHSSKSLNEYCWWVENSNEKIWPVGWKRPNPLGLLDTYGNVFEWCHEVGVPFQASVHPMRGGSYRSTQRVLCSSLQSDSQSVPATSTMGFRVVRIRK